MSWRRALDRALDRRDDAPGPVEVHHAGGAVATVDVERAGPIGARVRGLRLRHGEDRDVAEEAARIARDVRSLPHRLAPVEVAPALGGAILRSRAGEAIDEGFFEVRVDGAREVRVRRRRIASDGQRTDQAFDLTRDQLGRLLRELDG